MENLNPPAVIGEAIAGRSAHVRKQLMVLVGDIAERTLDLAELLLEAQEESLYRAWNYNSIAEYGAQELGLKERKVQYLIRIVKVCKAVGLQRSAFEDVGVSKLRDICSLDPEGSHWNAETKASEPLNEHIVRLVSQASQMTGEQVEEEVRRLKGMVGENRPVMRSYSVTQSAWDNTIRPAMELARRRLGSAARDEDTGNAIEYGEGVCLEVICAEFLADANSYPEEEYITMEEVLAIPSYPMEEI